jgi:glycosyltransferase involved in cell wall biosynthesis
MRIVYVTSSLPFGPPEAFLIPEVEELRAQGHQVLLVPQFPRGRLIHKDAAPLLDFTATEPPISPRILCTALIQTILHPGRTANLVGALCRSRTLRIAAKNAAIMPKGLWLGNVATKFRADHIHAHWGGCSATMAMIGSHVSGIGWSLTLHSWELVENNLLALKARDAKFVRIISGFGQARFAREIDDSARLQVLHLGIRIPEPLRPEIEDGNTPCIALIGAMEEVKGHEYLLAAWKILKERGILIHVDFVGSGPRQRDLEARVRNLEAEDQIRFRGQVSHVELLSNISDGRWKALVLPSIATKGGEQEGIPIALVEAMAYGVPVIATSTGGIPELLDGGAGLMIPQKDAEALANAIEEVISNPELRASLRKTGRKRIEEQYSIDEVVRRLVEMMAN